MNETYQNVAAMVDDIWEKLGNIERNWTEMGYTPYELQENLKINSSSNDFHEMYPLSQNTQCS